MKKGRGRESIEFKVPTRWEGQVKGSVSLVVNYGFDIINIGMWVYASLQISIERDRPSSWTYRQQIYSKRMACNYCQPVTVTRSFCLCMTSLGASMHAHGQALDPTKSSVLKSFAVTISTKAALNQLLNLVDTRSICAGHSDQHFLDRADSCSGKFQSISKSSVQAFINTAYPIF